MSRFSGGLGGASGARNCGDRLVVCTEPIIYYYIYHAIPPSKDPFWTACQSCCYVHQYSREYLNQTIRCPNCRQGFRATKLAASPPVVPGTDMYYCSWGFFPLGFPGAPDIFAKGDLNAEWKPFFPMSSCSRMSEPLRTSNHQQQDMARSSSNPHGKPQNNGNNENLVEPESMRSGMRSKKMAVKKVGRPRKYHLASGNHGKSSASVELPKVPEPWPVSEAMPINVGGVQGRDININQEIKTGSEDGVHAVDDYTINFHIDVNATDEILDNLQNLPFLRDEELHLRMP
ncbi:uncharacterized protein LOC122025206 [Zingiber officinale]|uniref:uncharacterized protein LOC122025206 n=1 Tax=Zingiber officinale TaxID=94328 RepID=UPI001C4ACF61|nr:uncharacterized protein LOC122025206 [Zingiber officinale]